MVLGLRAQPEEIRHGLPIPKERDVVRIILARVAQLGDLALDVDDLRQQRIVDQRLDARDPRPVVQRQAQVEREALDGGAEVDLHTVPVTAGGQQQVPEELARLQVQDRRVAVDARAVQGARRQLPAPLAALVPRARADARHGPADLAVEDVEPRARVHRVALAEEELLRGPRRVDHHGGGVSQLHLEDGAVLGGGGPLSVGLGGDLVGVLGVDVR